METTLLQYEAEGAALDPDEQRTGSFLASVGSPPMQRSPQKIRNLLVSPRRTPLLFHNRHGGPQSIQLGVGDFQSPREKLEQINLAVQGVPPSPSKMGSPSPPLL